MIHADHLLEANQGRIKAIWLNTQKWQEEIKQLRKNLEIIKDDPVSEILNKSKQFLMS